VYLGTQFEVDVYGRGGSSTELRRRPGLGGVTIDNSTEPGDDGRGLGTPVGSPLLNLSDLAARWDISEREAIEVARRRGVPFFRVTYAINRVGWDKMRFLLASVEEWERANLQRFKGEMPRVASPLPRRKSASVDAEPRQKSRLDNWREPSPLASRPRTSAYRSRPG
jgi:hypothetical protein